MPWFALRVMSPPVERGAPVGQRHAPGAASCERAAPSTGAPERERQSGPRRPIVSKPARASRANPRKRSAMAVIKLIAAVLIVAFTLGLGVSQRPAEFARALRSWKVL